MAARLELPAAWKSTRSRTVPQDSQARWLRADPAIQRWPSPSDPSVPPQTRDPPQICSPALVARGRSQCPNIANAPLSLSLRCSDARALCARGPLPSPPGPLGAGSALPGRSASAVQPYPARPGRDPTREPGRGSATSATTGQPQHRPGRDATIGLGSDVRGPGQPLSEEPIPGERKKCRGPRLACYSCNKCPGFPPRVAFLSCSPASPRTPGPGPLGCAPLSPHRSPAPARGSRAPHL